MKVETNKRNVLNLPKYRVYIVVMYLKANRGVPVKIEESEMYERNYFFSISYLSLLFFRSYQDSNMGKIRF